MHEEDSKSSKETLDDTKRILEATQKLQSEIRRRNMQPVYHDQLYLNLAEGRSLRAALLMSAKSGGGKKE